MWGEFISCIFLSFLHRVDRESVNVLRRGSGMLDVIYGGRSIEILGLRV